MIRFIKNLYTIVSTQTAKIPFWIHLLLLFVAVGAWMGTSIPLDASYAASQFPVPYYEGQTTFDGELLKTYYGHMIEQGTLGIYWRTQFIDFLFIAAVIFTGFIVPSFVARLHPAGSWLRAVTLGLAVALMLGGMSDAIENLISFVQLAAPLTFPNWITLIYSSFAVIKFGLIGLAVTGTLLSLALAAATAVWRAVAGRQMALA